MSSYAKKQATSIFLLLVFLAATLGILTWGNTALQTSTYTVSSHTIPQSFNCYTIAQVSDLHNAEFGEGNERLLEKLREAEPDIIVFTGDIVDSHKTNVQVAVQFAQQAQAIAPTYYITGNHEAGLGKARIVLENQLSTGGTVILRHQALTLERGSDQLNLIGIDDPTILRSSNQNLTELVQEDTYNLLLAHRPENFKEYAAAGADLTLTGHAHGGQIRLPFLGGLIAPNQGFFPEYDAGLFTEGESHMIVSRGLGNSLFPLRINNRPELVVVQLVHR